MKRLLPFVFFAITMNAWTNEATQLSDKSALQQQATSVQATMDARNNLQGTVQSPIIVRVLPDSNAEEKEALNSKLEGRKSFFDGMTALATLALALVTAALAVFTYRLWKVTGALVREDEASAEKELRAYVRVEAFRIKNFNIHQSTEIAYQLTNVGRTPAHNVRARSEVQVLPYPLPPDYLITVGELPKTSDCVLFGGDEYASIARSINPIAASEIEAIKIGKTHRLYIVCFVTYADIFEKARSTQYVACMGGQAMVDAFATQQRMRFEYTAFGNKIT